MGKMPRRKFLKTSLATTGLSALAFGGFPDQTADTLESALASEVHARIEAAAPRKPLSIIDTASLILPVSVGPTIANIAWDWMAPSSFVLGSITECVEDGTPLVGSAAFQLFNLAPGPRVIRAWINVYWPNKPAGFKRQLWAKLYVVVLGTI